MSNRKINSAHFAFYRGWLEGLDLADLGERYLISGRELPAAKQTLRWLQDELIASARRSRPPIARLLKLSPSQIAHLEHSSTISLDEFQATADPDGFYSESELIERQRGLIDEATRTERSDVAASLETDIRLLDSEIAAQSSVVAAKLRERNAVVERFEEHRRRYVELTSAPESARIPPMPRR